jgi:hypothetical protein
MSKQALANYDQVFYINGRRLPGILSVDGSYVVKYKPINTIGKGYSKMIYAEIPEATFSINSNLIYQDILLNYTGEASNNIAESFGGSINYGYKNIGFDAGYLQSYSMSCTVGEVPKTQSSIKIFSDFGGSYDYQGSSPPALTAVPQTKDITISCDGMPDIRVQSFSFDISCPKEAIYTIKSDGSYIPYRVQSKMPIEIDCSFTAEYDDSYTLLDAFDTISTEVDKSFSISVNGSVYSDQQILIGGGTTLLIGATTEGLWAKQGSGINLFSFSNSNAKLISQQVNSESSSFSSVKLVYKTYLMS